MGSEGVGLSARLPSKKRAPARTLFSDRTPNLLAFVLVLLQRPAAVIFRIVDGQVVIQVRLERSSNLSVTGWVAQGEGRPVKRPGSAADIGVWLRRSAIGCDGVVVGLHKRSVIIQNQIAARHDQRAAVRSNGSVI